MSGVGTSSSALPGQVRRVAFGLVLLGAGIGPLAPAMENTPALRLIVQMLFVLAGALWMMAAAFEGVLRVARSGFGLFLLLLAAALLCATINAYYRYPAMLTLFSWLSGMIAFFIVLNEARSRRRRLALFLVIASTTFIVSAHGLHQIFVELPHAEQLFSTDPVGVLKQLNLPIDTKGDFLGRVTSRRIFSSFLVANSLGGFLVLVVPGIIGFLLDWQRRRRPGTPVLRLALAGVMLLIALLALYWTKSKGSWVAMAAGLTVFVFWAFRDTIRRRWRQVVCAVAALMIVWSIAQLSGLLPPLGDYVGSMGVRVGYWRGATLIFQDHPVMGVGLDNFADFYATVKRPEDQEARRAHNDFLQIAAEGGAIALIAYLAFWIHFWRRVQRPRGEPALPEDISKPFIRPEALNLAILGAAILLIEFLCGGTLLTQKGFWGLQWPVVLWLGWTAFAALYARTEDPLPLGRHSAATIGVACGLIAFIVHSLSDFDHYVGGILQTAWILMGLLLAARMSEESDPVKEYRLHPVWRLAALIVPMGLALALLYGAVLPVIESSALRERARDFSIQRTMVARRLDLEQAIAMNPFEAHNYALLSDLYLHLWLSGYRDGGITLRGTSPLSEAILQVGEAIKRNPMRAEYHTRYGRLHELRWRSDGSAHDFEEARAGYQRAEERFPSNPDMAINLARLYDLRGGHDEEQLALGKYRRALAIDASDMYHHTRRFSPEERQEIEERVAQIKFAHTRGMSPPPVAFRSTRLSGIPAP